MPKLPISSPVPCLGVRSWRTYLFWWSLAAPMLGISRCASDSSARSKVANSPQMKLKVLGSTREALDSFACAPLAHLTWYPQDSCTRRPRFDHWRSAWGAFVPLGECLHVVPSWHR